MSFQNLISEKCPKGHFIRYTPFISRKFIEVLYRVCIEYKDLFVLLLACFILFHSCLPTYPYLQMYNQIYLIHAEVHQHNIKIVQLNILKFKLKSLVHTYVHVLFSMILVNQREMDGCID